LFHSSPWRGSLVAEVCIIIDREANAMNLSQGDVRSDRTESLAECAIEFLQRNACACLPHVIQVFADAAIGGSLRDSFANVRSSEIH
jgi:hypothetical protein